MKEREKFGSRLGFILVSAGCAIGLGNVWKFPYICGQNGGAAFILVYLLCLIGFGLPILVCEFAIGRKSRKSIVKAFDELEPEHTAWHRFGKFGIAGNYLLMMFYTMVAGWMLAYAYRMIRGTMAGISTEAAKTEFEMMTSNPGELIFWTIIVIAVSFGVCAKGLQNGVEKITKVMMLLLIGLMVVLAVNSVFLPNAVEGVKFYLIPDFGKMLDNGIGTVIFNAMSHAFFTLSVGMGSMEIFGSYLNKDRKLLGEAGNVLVLDTFVALTAGFIIIPACFAYGIEPDAGPSLLFITLPTVFAHMKAGMVWGTLFFIFMTFAALSTVIAVFENIIAMTMDATGWSRAKTVWINLGLVTLLSLPAILGFNVLSFIEPLGAKTNLMDLEDFIVSYNILPLGSLLFVLFCVKKNGWGFDRFLAEVNEGKGKAFPKALKAYMTYVIPSLIVIIYLKGYYDFFAKQEVAIRIFWMVVALLFLALVTSFTLNKKKK
nr:sodium-dependent transporter [Lachnospiraceae bacterium]